MEQAVNIDSEKLRKALRAYHSRRGGTDGYLSTRRLKKGGSYISYSLSRGRMGVSSLELLCQIIGIDVSEVTTNNAETKQKPEEVVHTKSKVIYHNDIRRMLDEVSAKQQAINTILVEIYKELGGKGWQ